MRRSCNGCRVLRKGCTENCGIRPCLDWIKSSHSQANATLFLAKFYGRSRFLNLINGGPSNLPSIFKSLLHEACGRILNPVHGSAGLVSTGNWHLCQEAVEAVLSGSPISQISLDSAGGHVSTLLSACDIRHVSKHEKASGRTVRKLKNRTWCKRSAVRNPKVEVTELEAESSEVDYSRRTQSWASDSVSIETVEDIVVKPIGPQLILGLFPIMEAHTKENMKEEKMNGCDLATWSCDLTLGLSQVICSSE